MTYFPILILLIEENKKVVCRTVEDIPIRIAFKVLETMLPEKENLSPILQDLKMLFLKEGSSKVRYEAWMRIIAENK